MPQLTTIHTKDHHQTLLFIDAEAVFDREWVYIYQEEGGRMGFPSDNVSYFAECEVTDEELVEIRATHGEAKLKRQLGFE